MRSENAAAGAADEAVRAFTKAVRLQARRLTRRELSRAIVLDFEGPGRPKKGNPPKAPQILGVLTPHGNLPPDYRVFILDPALSILAKSTTGAWCGATVADLPAALAQILELAQKGRGRPVIWFSSHESAVIGPVLRAHPELAALHDRCADVKVLMDSLSGRGELDGEPDDDRSLEYYAKEFGAGDLLARQDALGVAPAKVLRELVKACGNVRRLRKLPLEVREKAARLLEYNRLDCEMTRVCALVARERRRARASRSAGRGRSA